MSSYHDDDDSQSSFEEASWSAGDRADGAGAGDGIDSWDELRLPEGRQMQARRGDDCATVTCGECGKLIFDDTPRCPYCGFLQLEAAREKKPWWFVATVIFLAVMLSGVASIVLFFRLHGPGH